MSEVVCTNDLGFVASVQRSANIPLFELLCASGGRVLYSSAPTVRVGDGRCAGGAPSRPVLYDVRQPGHPYGCPTRSGTGRKTPADRPGYPSCMSVLNRRPNRD